MDLGQNHSDHIKVNLNNPVPIIRSSNSHKSVESLPALIPSIFW